METRERFKFLTNNFTLLALTIAQIYKCRWQVELFFENSTWCTPLDVNGISRVSCSELTVGVVDGWLVSSGPASLDLLLVQNPGRAHTGLRCW